MSDEEGLVPQKARDIVRTVKGPAKAAYDFPGLRKGVVLASHRRSCEIQNTAGEILSCSLPANLDLGPFGKVVAGDEVLYSGEVGQTGLIARVLPRKNDLWRLGPHSRGARKHLLAANVDRVFIMLSVSRPGFKVGLFDRFVVHVASLGLPYFVGVNKMDLTSSTSPELEYLVEKGYPIYLLSVAKGSMPGPLINALARGVTALIGPSGVGKSSLIQKLMPGEKITVGHVRQGDGKGRHTTVSSRLYPLSTESWILDSPGLREMTPEELSPRQLAPYFLDFSPYLSDCEFRDCAHLNESGCGIKAAVTGGQVASFHYESYRSLLLKGENRRGF